jgi:hypothetical protein
MAAFWVIAPYSLVEVYQRFRGPCCLHYQGDRPETSVNFYQTTLRYNPEDSLLSNILYETVKKHTYKFCMKHNFFIL